MGHKLFIFIFCFLVSGCTSTKFTTVNKDGYPISAKRTEWLRKSTIGHFEFNPLTGQIYLADYRNETDAKDLNAMIGLLTRGLTSAYEVKIEQETKELELMLQVRRLELEMDALRSSPPARIETPPVVEDAVPSPVGYREIDRDGSESFSLGAWKAPFSVTFDWDVDGGKSGGLVECGKFARGPFSMFIKKPWEYCIRFGDKSKITLSDPQGIKLKNPSREEDHFLYGLKIPKKRHSLTLSFDGSKAVVSIDGVQKASWSVEGSWRGANVPVIVGATPSNPHDFPHGVAVKLWGVNR